MVTFADLMNVKKVQNTINYKLDKIKQLESDTDGIHSKRIEIKVQGGKEFKPYSQYRAEQIEKLKREVWELSDYQSKVWDQINKLENTFHQMLLIDEYILGNDAVEKRRKKKGQGCGYTRKELQQALKEAETSFMLLCMSESMGESDLGEKEKVN